MLGFVVRMLVYYAVLHALYFLIPMSILHDGIYLQVFGRSSAWLIHLMVPAEGVTALTNRIASPRAILEIVRGCDGSGVLAHAGDWRAPRNSVGFCPCTPILFRHCWS